MSFLCREKNIWIADSGKPRLIRFPESLHKFSHKSGGNHTFDHMKIRFFFNFTFKAMFDRFNRHWLQSLKLLKRIADMVLHGWLQFWTRLPE